jgi:hypothetical protein
MLLSPTCIADTGSTGHFLTIHAPSLNRRPANPSISVLLPDGSTITSTHTALLNIPLLPPHACESHIFPTLASGSLISIGKLCDHGCIATFTSDAVSITLNDTQILRGSRSATTGLWQLHLPQASPHCDLLTPSHTKDTPTPHHAANSLIPHQTLADRIAFYHATLFSPSLSTWCKAIDANLLATWPDLTSAQVRKHPPISSALVKGHLDQSRANQRSTKPKATTTNKPQTTSPNTNHFAALEATNVVNTTPTNTYAEPTNDKLHLLYADFATDTGKIFTDLTGRFVQPSISGHSDMLVVYDYDSNFIHVEAMTSKSGPDILAAYKRAHALLTSRGLRPRLQRLDNEASKALQQFMHSEEVDFQLAPPHVHRRNAAERAIRTFKNHLIAGLCSTDRDFPLNLWDRLLPQALITLNLLRQSRINPLLSAYAQVHGAFDYNRTPMAPPGTRVMIHEKPSARKTWAPHAVDGWYLGPALRHYRCYRVWSSDTCAERIVDTLTWLPTQVRMPTLSTNDLLLAAANDIVSALRTPSGPTLQPSETAAQRVALLTLSTIFADCAAGIAPDTTAPTPGTPAHTPPAPGLPAPLPRVPIPTSSAPPASTNTYARQSKSHPRRQRAPKPNSTPTHATADNDNAPNPTASTTTSTTPANPHQTRSRSKAAPARSNCVLSSAHIDLNTPLIVAFPPPAADPTTKNLSHHEWLFHYANAVIDPATGASLEYPQLLRGTDAPEWIHGTATEIGRLAQGHHPHSNSGSDTLFFIKHTDKPADRVATYLRIVAALRPHKAESKRIRFTMGGDRIIYEGNVSTPTADLTTVKVLINSVLSTPHAKFMSIDIKDFYLGTPMARYEYVRIPVKYIPPDIMAQYQLQPLVHNDHVLAEVRKGMYGLPQAGILAYERLAKHLTAHGYFATANTPGLFRHRTRPITFSLVVDDFGIKYIGEHNAQHLIDTLQLLYTVTTDWGGTLYCGLTLAWDYVTRTCDVSMPGYVSRALTTLQHPAPTRAQHAPHAWATPAYGAKVQYAAEDDTTPPLSSQELTRLQQIIGIFLYYARAIDSTMLVALGTLASAQTKGTAATTIAVTQLLNYCASHPDATLRFSASQMALHVHSDASYLSEKKARSRAGGIFFLSNQLTTPDKAPLPDDTPPPNNGAIHVHSSIMSAVLSSATEAELGALFFNGKEAAMLRNTLRDMGHPQSATPIQTDNACAAGIANDTVKQRRTKAMDMRFYWIRDRVRQGHFLIHWRKGTDNLADYFTKHHAPSHHRLMRQRYLLELHTSLPTQP